MDTNPVPVYRIPAVQWSCRGTLSYVVDKQDNISSLSSRTRIYHRQPLLELHPEIRDPSVYIPSRTIAGMNLDIHNNIRVLNNEISSSSSSSSTSSSSSGSGSQRYASSPAAVSRMANPFSYVLQPGDPQTEQIRIMYQWLQRIESSLKTLSFHDPSLCLHQQLIFEHIAASASTSSSSSVINPTQQPMVSTEVPCGSLTAFTHPLRTAALTLCGWSPLASLMDGSKLYLSNTLVHDTTTHRPVSSIEAVAAAVPIPLIRLCCEMGQVERAAAIALLHGYSGVAVQLLQLAADDIRYNYALSLQSPDTKYVGPHPSHAELLQLTAMAVAGCPGPATGEEDTNSAIPTSLPPPTMTTTTHQQRNATRDIWLASCRSLMTRIDGRWHPYLKVMLTVLVEVADPALVTTPIEPTAEPVGSSRTLNSSRKLNTFPPKTNDNNTNEKSEKKVRFRPMHRVDTLFSYSDANHPSEHPSVSALSSSSAVSDDPIPSTATVSQVNTPSTTHSFYASPRLSAQTSPTLPTWGRETPRTTPLSFNDNAPLTRDNEEHIEISLHDRVAFACRFLDDARLPEYIARITGECITTGRIDGLLLTGLSPYGAILLQNYIDNTGDAQTGAIVGHYFLRFTQTYLLHRWKSLPSVALSSKDFRVTTLTNLLPVPLQQMVGMSWRFIQSYRNLLNQFQLWQYRAKLDIQRALLLGYQHSGNRKTNNNSNNNSLSIGSSSGIGGNISSLASYVSSDTLASAAVSSSASTDSSSSFNLLEFEHQSYLTLVSLIEDMKSKDNASETIVHDRNDPLQSPGYYLVRPPVLTVSPSTIDSSTTTVTVPPVLPPTGRTISSLLPSTNQLYVKCPSCRISLHLPSLVDNSTTAVEWLSKQRPHLISCPSCRKHLPRCELCLLPMGVINPVLQLQYEMAQRNSSNNMNSNSSSNLYSLRSADVPNTVSSSSSSLLSAYNGSGTSMMITNPSSSTFPTPLSTFQAINNVNTMGNTGNTTTSSSIPDINYSKIMDEGINLTNPLLENSLTSVMMASSSSSANSTVSAASSPSESSKLANLSSSLNPPLPEDPQVTLISDRITGSGVGLLGPMALTPSGRLRDAVRMDELWCWCQSCHHGGHTSHLLDWFTTKTVCPVAQCMCHCIKQDSAYASALGILPTVRLPNDSKDFVQEE